MGRTEKVIEKFAAVFVWMEAIVDVGLKTGIHMAVVELSIQDKENRICAKKKSISQQKTQREQAKRLYEPSLTKGAINSASGHSVLA